MTIHVIDLGPGRLTLTAPEGGTQVQVAAQLTNCRVAATEAVTAGARTPVLSGEELVGQDSARYTYTLAGTLFQDFGGIDVATVDAVVDWSWDHKGKVCDFEFVPNTAGERKVVGTTHPIPIQIGGPITGTPTNRGPNPTSDFTWRAKGPVDVVTGIQAPDPIREDYP